MDNIEELYGPQGFSQDELKSYGIEAEEQEPAKAAGPSPEEIQQLLAQNLQEQQHQTALLQRELSQVKRSQYQPPVEERPLPDLPESVPITFDAEGRPVMATKDLLSLNKAVLDEYHRTVVDPLSPVVQSVAQQKQLKDTIKWLENDHPDMIKDRDPEQVASLLWGYYNSPLNDGRDDGEKTAYAIQQFQQANLPSGNKAISKTVQPSNQVGRTEGGGMPQLPYGKNAKIAIPRKSASEIGHDAFQQSVAYEAYLRDLNDKHNMGWDIQLIRPD